MKTLVKQVRNRLLKNLHTIPFVKNPSDLAYQIALEKHIRNLPIIHADDMMLVSTLKKEGVVITSLAALSIPSTSQVLQAAESLIPQISKNRSGSKNEFVTHATSEQIMESSEIFFWGLEQRLLNIAEHYLCLPVAYHGTYFRQDFVNTVQRKSRLWHTDMEDRKMLKIIIYLNDVNEDGGPFQYIPKSFTSTITQSLRYNFSYISDKTMQRIVSLSNWKSCIGSSGTVIFADTANIFHRGKIPIASDRFTIFYDYTSRQPKCPYYCKSSLPQDDLQLLSTQFSENQRRCVFWQ